MGIKTDVPSMLKIERSVFEQFINHTLRHSEYEWGGLLLSREVNGEAECIAAVLPPQKKQSPGFCEFKKELFPVIQKALDEIETKYHDASLKIVTWIHTHPNLGVFLSTTDHATYTYLSKLNPAITAIVVDPVNYEWLSVNSLPGSVYGFTALDLDLNLLIANKDNDPKLGEKLELLKVCINSDKSKKMLNIAPSDRVEVFMPVSIDVLLRDIIKSNIEGIQGLLQRLKKSVFNVDSSIVVKPQKEQNSAIQEVVDYIAQFRAIEKEIRSWRGLTVNRRLLDVDLIPFMERQPDEVKPLIMHMRRMARAVKGVAAFQLGIWDDFLQYSSDSESKRVRWSAIKDFEIEMLHEEPAILGISFRTSIFKAWRHLIVCVLDAEKFDTAIKSKVNFKKGTRIRNALELNTEHVKKKHDAQQAKEEKSKHKLESKEKPGNAKALEHSEKDNKDDSKDSGHAVTKEPASEQDKRVESQTSQKNEKNAADRKFREDKDRAGAHPSTNTGKK